MQVNVHEAKTHLSRLLEAVERGEDVVISRAGHPVARLVPVAADPDRRILGRDRGTFVVPDDFDDPLPPDVLAGFTGVKLLLDTHVWLWMIVEPERLGAEAAAALADRRNDLRFSVASAWEIAIKYGLGKLPLPLEPAQFIPPRLLRDGVAVLPVELHHALAVSALPAHHSDPFDRMLVAQARAESLVLVTNDPKIAAYDVPILHA